jgi:hypothetical protein
MGIQMKIAHRYLSKPTGEDEAIKSPEPIKKRDTLALA